MKKAAPCSEAQSVAEILSEADSYVERDALAHAFARYKCAHSRLPPEQKRAVSDALPVTFWQRPLTNDDLRSAVGSAQGVFRSLVRH